MEVFIIRNCNESTNNILNSALNEFLEKGFEKASMRTISKNAGVTTGALYARFPNKDALFGALAEPVISKFLATNNKHNQKSFDTLNNGKAQEIWSSTTLSTSNLVDIIYENKQVFSLIINCSTGSSYENFIDKIVSIEEKETLEFLEILKSKGFPCENTSHQVVHMLVSAHCHALFEVVRHDSSKDEAILEVNQINEFFITGWNKIFGI